MYAPYSPRQIPHWCKIVVDNKSVSDSDTKMLQWLLVIYVTPLSSFILGV